MREILFRGKRVDNGEWVYGYFEKLCIELENGKEITFHYIQGLTINEGYMINPETVGQFTGLTDKNGNKIFEGDIVEFEDKYTGGKGRAEIVFEAFKWKYSGCYYGGNPIVWLCIDDLSIKFEVIGNIYDNPELLEREK